MTGPQQYDDLVASRSRESGTGASLHGVVVHVDPPSSPSPAADLSNVIPFKRGRRAGTEPSTPPVTISPEDRPAPPPPVTSVAKQIALVACSLAAHIVLEEGGEKYEARRMDLSKGEQRTPKYMKIHPLGRVPALQLHRAEPIELLVESAVGGSWLARGRKHLVVEAVRVVVEV